VAKYANGRIGYTTAQIGDVRKHARQVNNLYRLTPHHYLEAE